MPAATPKVIRNNFNSGEISPFIVGRIDQQRYFNALTTMENWIPLVQGGMQVRPGTIYAGAAKSTGHPARLIEFKFSAADQLILEFGHLSIRFWRFNSTTGLPEQVTSGGNPVEVTTTYAYTDLAYLQTVQSGDVLYIVGGNPPQAPMKLFRQNSNSATWGFLPLTFNPPPTAEETLSPADTLTLTSSTHWTTTTFAFLAGDVGRSITTTDGGVGVITAIDGGGLGVTVQVLTVPPGGGPYTTGQWSVTGSPNAGFLYAGTSPPAVNSVVTFEAISSFGTNPGTVDSFRAADVGKYISALGGVIQIVSLTNAHTITAQVLTPLTAWVFGTGQGANVSECAPAGAWTLETPVWGASTGYPSCISLHQQRLLAGNWTGYPDTIRGSQTGDYMNFAAGTADDNGLDFTFSSGTVVPIQWMCPDLNLIVGTLTREFYCGDLDGTPLTPTSPKLAPEGSTGACGIQPIVLESAVLFVARGQQQVGEILYNVLSNRGEVVDLTEFANHLTLKYLFTANAAQVEPVPIAWFIRSDGTACGLVYRRKQQVAAWFRMTTWRGSTQDTIESVAVIQNPVSQKDRAWFSVNRNGTRYIEAMDDFPNPYYGMDCSYKYSGAATATISGLTWMNGWTVGILGKAADGLWRLYPNQTVSSNHVTGLSPTVVEAQVGLIFPATGVITPAEFPAAHTTQGKPKSYGAMQVRTYSTSSLKIQGVRYPNDGYSASSVYLVPITGIPPNGALSTVGNWADFEVSNSGVDRLSQVSFIQDLPLGGTVLMFTADLVVGA